MFCLRILLNQRKGAKRRVFSPLIPHPPPVKFGPFCFNCLSCIPRDSLTPFMAPTFPLRKKGGRKLALSQVHLYCGAKGRCTPPHTRFKRGIVNQKNGLTVSQMQGRVRGWRGDPFQPGGWGSWPARGGGEMGGWGISASYTLPKGRKVPPVIPRGQGGKQRGFLWEAASYKRHLRRKGGSRVPALWQMTGETPLPPHGGPWGGILSLSLADPHLSENVATKEGTAWLSPSIPNSLKGNRRPRRPPQIPSLPGAAMKVGVPSPESRCEAGPHSCLDRRGWGREARGRRDVWKLKGERSPLNQARTVSCVTD